MNNIKEIKHNNIRWVNIESPSRADIDYLKNNFSIHQLDLEDILSPTQRSKIDKYEKYLFLILIFPVFNRKTKEIEDSEVDIFLSKDYIITVHHGNLPPIKDMFELCKKSEQARDNIFKNSSQLTLYEILNRLFLYCYPIMDHISLDIQSIKKQIFSDQEKEMVKKILVIRRNITDLRKIMQSYQITLEKLLKDIGVNEENFYIIHEKYFPYYDNLIDYVKEIWQQLASFKESIEALQETNESLISARLNKVMKVLTLISVIMLPATLIASLFGVNAENIPFAGNSYDFWWIALTTMASAILMMVFIWRKKWF